VGRYVGSSLVLIYPRATFSLPSAIPRGWKRGSWLARPRATRAGAQLIS